MVRVCITMLFISLIGLVWAFAGQPWPEAPPPGVIYIEPSAGHADTPPMPDQHYTTDDGAL